jgi:hypothetical protein
MPVARIYASLVEEAEPICADLLARGYNVEIVFPDAVLPTPADLELRVERCSAEQAIARVEAGGSPSRCVFMTPGKGPRRELLLVEMTVLATGTDGRHPMAMPIPVALPTPVPAPLPTSLPAQMAVADGQVPNVPVALAGAQSADSGWASVLPFPAGSPEALAVDVSEMEPARSHRDKDQNLSGNLIAELNAFLAHAPVMERPEGLHVRILENMRHSASAERARKNWESLTLAGVAASVVMLIALGWYAGPKRPRQAATAAGTPVVHAAGTPAMRAAAPPVMRAATPRVLADVSSLRAAPESLQTVGLTMETSSAPLKLAARRHRFVRGHRRIQPSMQQDDLVAQDEVMNKVRQPAAKPWPTRSSQPATTSELRQPPAIRSAPVKIITDLK